ncbi:NAD-dependent deacetylase [Sulfurospirillum sp.]|nr:NAD-dependent deacetylase [Sulfurospirillum sp.]
MINKYDGKKKILIFSGAGISAESGISTFRDANGLWDNYNIEDICHQRSWKKNFDLVHEFYNKRRVQLSTVEPNQAHFSVARIKKMYKDDCYVVTQNVDDLFERAGCEDVIHVHGELTKMECTACGHVWDMGYKAFDLTKDRCPKCNSLKGVKPFVVFFGGQAPQYISMYRAFEVCKNKDSLLIVVGTMGNVVPVESLIEGTPCKKILNNLEKSKHINDELFNEIYYEKATVAVKKIESNIQFT